MKKIILKHILLTLLLLLGSADLSASTRSGKKDFTKFINKEFPIDARGNVNIHNRRGTVTINTWENDRVKIEVTITVKTASEKKANALFDRVSIDFTNSEAHVFAETSIEPYHSSWRDWFGNSGNPEYAINYEVYMPKTCALDVKNKYGNTAVQAIDGEAVVSVAYGDIHMDGVSGKLNISLAYGNATIANAGEVNLQIKHSKIRLKKIKDISLQSKYSTVRIEEAKDISSTSKHDTYRFGSIQDFRNQGKYDNIDIDSAGNLTIATKHTDLRVAYLRQSCNFDFSYGGASVDQMGEGFTEIRIEGAYADFKFGIPKAATYQLDASGKYAGIRFPPGLEVIYQSEKGAFHEVEAYRGNKMASSIIKARLRYGGLKLIRY